MTDRVSVRRKRHAPDKVVGLYQEYLAEEMKVIPIKPEGDKVKGRAKGASRRAMDRVSAELGYVSYQSVRLALDRWNKARSAEIETFGRLLDPEFSRAVRILQDGVDNLLSVCADLKEGLKALDLEAQDTLLEDVDDIMSGLKQERPGVLCPYCKQLTEECSKCDGDGWWDSLDGDIDPRLTDPVNVHVMQDGKIVPLESEEL